MNVDNVTWLSYFSTTESPVLPIAWGMQIWLRLGWGVVLACAVAWPVKSWSARWRVALAATAALWCWIAGPYSPTHWLGLAFQAPSISSVLLCGLIVWEQFFPPESASAQANPYTQRRSLIVAGLAVVLGWLLLLDSLAMLPFSVYAWGFGPAAIGLTMVVLCVPWVCARRETARDAAVWVAPIALVLFVILRLPSGNLWDALLDPWLWAGLNVYVIRRLR
jgi:hypothetical protein